MRCPPRPRSLHTLPEAPPSLDPACLPGRARSPSATSSSATDTHPIPAPSPANSDRRGTAAGAARAGRRARSVRQGGGVRDPLGSGVGEGMGGRPPRRGALQHTAVSVQDTRGASWLPVGRGLAPARDFWGGGRTVGHCWQHPRTPRRTAFWKETATRPLPMEFRTPWEGGWQGQAIQESPKPHGRCGGQPPRSGRTPAGGSRGEASSCQEETVSFPPLGDPGVGFQVSQVLVFHRN